MKHDLQIKNIFYLTLFAGCYFLLAFNGVLQSTSSKLIGGLFELFTIPLILLIVAIFVFSLYQFLIKGIKLTFYSSANLLVSSIVIVAMFFVN